MRIPALALAVLLMFPAVLFVGRAVAIGLPPEVPGRSVTSAAGAGKVGAALSRRLAESPDERVAAWVYFTDRGGAEHDPARFDAARRALTSRAVERRLRRGVLGTVVESDLPVHAPYVAALSARGARLRGTSRWLNAASIEAPPRLVVELAGLPFVSHVDLVPLARGMEPVGEPEPAEPVGAVLVPGGALDSAVPAQVLLAPGDRAYYGSAFKQLDIMQVPALHALGLSGAGVVVCILDGGFRVTHRAYAGLHVLARRDFVYGDSVVDDQAGQDPPGAASHGTMTLGCIAGSLPGTYSGGAFGVTVALGKTENVASETPVEMDYWQFGVEWADSLGADVVSSSLGYFAFDDTTQSYHYSDMNGVTTVVSRAAVEAARRGITVVTAAGNEGASPWHYIIAPGDADSVITVGAVDTNNVVASFSSRGPTSDGRIKPDVTANGVRAYCLAFTNDSTYVRASGTSFSTPLTAGVVALLLEANPTWGPFEVREALRETALNHLAPNNDVGWGLVQGLAARSWIPSTTGIADGAPAGAGRLVSASPNPVRAGSPARITFTASGDRPVSLDVFDLGGRRRARLFEGVAGSTRTVRWSGTDDGGAALDPGVYWIRLADRSTPKAASARAVPIVVIR